MVVVDPSQVDAAQCGSVREQEVSEPLKQHPRDGATGPIPLAVANCGGIVTAQLDHSPVHFGAEMPQHSDQSRQLQAVNS